MRGTGPQGRMTCTFAEVGLAHGRDAGDDGGLDGAGVLVELRGRREAHGVGVARVLAGALVDAGEVPALVEGVLEPDRLLAFEDEVDDVVDGADDVPDVPADGVGDAAAGIAELFDGEAIGGAEGVLEDAADDNGELGGGIGGIAHAGQVRDIGHGETSAQGWADSARGQGRRQPVRGGGGDIPDDGR